MHWPGMRGVLNFVNEIYASLASPVFTTVKSPLFAKEDAGHA